MEATVTLLTIHSKETSTGESSLEYTVELAYASSHLAQLVCWSTLWSTCGNV